MSLIPALGVTLHFFLFLQGLILAAWACQDLSLSCICSPFSSSVLNLNPIFQQCPGTWSTLQPVAARLHLCPTVLTSPWRLSACSIRHTPASLLSRKLTLNLVVGLVSTCLNWCDGSFSPAASNSHFGSICRTEGSADSWRAGRAEVSAIGSRRGRYSPVCRIRERVKRMLDFWRPTGLKWGQCKSHVWHSF